MLTAAQMARLSPHFRLHTPRRRSMISRVVSGIVYVIRNGLQWKDAPKAYGPHKAHRNKIRQMRPHFLLRNLHRSDNHFLNQ
ncbi:transposase [Rhizobium jaguaris]|uniref:transposase n=1 Tax=Rhizobium jaguaris TaxID=1312183 RepID=UPI0039BFD0E4